MRDLAPSEIPTVNALPEMRHSVLSPRIRGLTSRVSQLTGHVPGYTLPEMFLLQSTRT